MLQEGNIDVLRGLSPPDTRARDQEGLTLLHWATDRGHEDIVTMLVDTDPELINMQVTNMDIITIIDQSNFNVVSL